MNRIKTIVIAVILIMHLVSVNVCAMGSMLENETPFLPVGEEINTQPSEQPQPDHSTDATINSDGNTGNNNESNSGSANSNGSNHISGGSSGGSSYKPTSKPVQEPITNTTEIPTQTEEKAEQNPFTDIKQDDWFCDDVMYVFQNKIMTGTSETEFSPYLTLNRAMMITILHRIDGDKSVYETNNFSDVENNSWYAIAVNWGFEHNIVSGTSETTFAPMSNLTREQLCVMLYNYTLYNNTKTTLQDISSYSDYQTVSDWAKSAVSWAVAEGIITGKGNSSLSPQDSATRAEAAAVIRRYLNKITEIEK